VTRDSKVELVYQQLREDIESGTLAPGTALGEVAVVARTGASRTPVREALRRLAADGLVDLAPHRGARVSRVSLRSVRDLFDLRTMLEPEAMRQAARATATDPQLRSTLTRMRTDLSRMQRRSASAARSTAFYELADRFDWAVVSATRNEHLRRVLADLRPHTARLRNLSHGDPGRIEASVVEHLRMCDALLAGDADEAAAACTEHLRQGLRTIVARLLGDDDGLADALDLGVSTRP
jgi:DNA-binding GntR family transcriptional regulator